MRINIFIPLVLCIIIFQTVISQDKIILEGKVFDNESKKELIYSHVYIKGITVGTYTNPDGSFLLVLPERLKNDTLVVSCLGYESLYTKVSEIKPDSILLAPKPNIIEEVSVISKFDPEKILKKAYKKRKVNYPYTEPYCGKAYYREYFMKDQVTTQMLEFSAIVTEKGLKYNPLQNTEIKIDSVYDFYHLDSVHVYGSFLFEGILFHDGLNKDRKGKYYLDSIFFLNNERHIAITFIPKRSDTITYESYSLHKVSIHNQTIDTEEPVKEISIKTPENYQYSSKKSYIINLKDHAIIEYSAAYNLLGEPEKFALKVNKNYSNQCSILVRYKKKGDRYYPLQVREQRERVFVLKKNLQEINYTINSFEEFIFTHIENECNEKICKRQFLFYEEFVEKYKDIMFDHITIKQFDDTFRELYKSVIKK